MMTDIQQMPQAATMWDTSPGVSNATGGRKLNQVINGEAGHGHNPSRAAVSGKVGWAAEVNGGYRP
jgi:hypothetical protein